MGDGTTPGAGAGTGEPGGTPFAPRPLVLGPGPALVLIGAAVLVASMFLDWLDLGLPVLTLTRTAAQTPVAFLFDSQAAPRDPSLLIVLVPVAALVLCDVLLFRHRIVTFFASVVTFLVLGLYTYQLNQFASRISKGTRAFVNPDVFDLLGIGVYVAFAGAVLLLAGALMTRPAPSRHPA